MVLILVNYKSDMLDSYWLLFLLLQIIYKKNVL